MLAQSLSAKRSSQRMHASKYASSTAFRHFSASLSPLRTAASTHHRLIDTTTASLQLDTLQQRTKDSFVVIGSGPAGLATALALQTVGLPVVVLEKELQLSGGGSALGLWTNAWRALDALGVGDDLRAIHPEVNKVDLCRNNGRTLRSFLLSSCDGGPHEFRGVRRSNLSTSLANKLHPDTILFSAPVFNITTTNNNNTNTTSSTVVELESGEKISCLAVIGADGVRGASVKASGRRPARLVGQAAIRGIARFPKGVPCDSIRQVWSVGTRAGMYPISEKELYWFVCFDASPNSPSPTDQVDIQSEAAGLLTGWEWNLPEIVQNTPLGDFSRSRIADRWTLPPSNADQAIQTFLNGDKPLLTLAGDALHPMTPNLGQGGCTALEDAVVLARTLKQSGLPSILKSSSSTSTSSSRGNNEGSNSSGSTATQQRIKEVIAKAFVEYEIERTKRCLPLTVRSFAMGAALQLPIAPVAIVRDTVVSTVFDPSHFLDHAEYDCGTLNGVAVGAVTSTTAGR